jgi:hypothetical protein
VVSAAIPVSFEENTLNATEKGKEVCATFVRNGYIDVNGRRIDTWIENIDTIELIDLGHEVAMLHFRTEEAIEAFVMGWSVFGLSRNHTMRDKPHDSKEAHADQCQTMPSNILQFRARR